MSYQYHNHKEKKEKIDEDSSSSLSFNYGQCPSSKDLAGSLKRLKPHCKRVHEDIKRSLTGCYNNAAEKKTKKNITIIHPYSTNHFYLTQE
jgi:hypothetical protein